MMVKRSYAAAVTPRYRGVKRRRVTLRRRVRVGKVFRARLHKRPRNPIRRARFGMRRNTMGSERPTGVSITQWSSKRRRYNLAKRRTKASNALRLIRSQLDPYLYAWTGVKAFSGNGNYWMQNLYIPGNETTFCPVYLYDLTSVKTSNDDGSPFSRLAIDNQGRARFYLETHTFNQSVQTGLGTEVYDKSGNSDWIPNKRALCKWVEVKMNCWGAKQKSTRWQIQIVRFTDDALVPQHNDAKDSNYAIGGTDDARRRSKFWNDTVKGWMYNPAQFSGGDFAKRVKVIRNLEFMLDPNTSIEEDTDPAVKTVKLFLNVDRVMNFLEYGGQLLTSTDINTNNVAEANNETQITGHSNPTSRLYLVVRASNYSAQTGVSPTNALSGSFDLRVRSKWLTAG